MYWWYEVMKFCKWYRNQRIIENNMKLMSFVHFIYNNPQPEFQPQNRIGIQMLESVEKF